MKVRAAREAVTAGLLNVTANLLHVARRLSEAHSEILNESQKILAAIVRARACAVKRILFFTGAGNSNLGDDEMPAAWLSHIAESSLLWEPYFAIQQSQVRSYEPESVSGQKVNRGISVSLKDAGFTKSYFLFPVLIVHREDASPVGSFHEFDAVIVGGGGLFATGFYADFHAHVAFVTEASAFDTPVYVAGAGVRFPDALLYTSLLQQARIVSIRDVESFEALHQLSSDELTPTGELDTKLLMRKTRMTGDMIAAAPQSLFSFPSLHFPPLPRAIPKELLDELEEEKGKNYATIGLSGTTQNKPVSGYPRVPASSTNRHAFDVWRRRFPICWMMKMKELDYMQVVLNKIFHEVDYILMPNDRPLTASQRFDGVNDSRILLYRKNATNLSLFLHQNCRMAVSMALHGAIYAIRLGIPTFGFGITSYKIRGTLRLLGGNELAQACFEYNTTIPSLARLLRCYETYRAQNVSDTIENVKVLFSKFLRDVDRSILTPEALFRRRARLDEVHLLGKSANHTPEPAVQETDTSTRNDDSVIVDVCAVDNHRVAKSPPGTAGCFSLQ